MAQSKKFNLGCLIYTHERVDDAKINQEIIRSLWQDSGFFGKISIVHAYNGLRSWYPKKHLEDVLIRQKNPGHFRGAADLMDAGVLAFHRRYPHIKYVVVLAADTWVLKPAYIADTIKKMEKNKQRWATCYWGLPKKYQETGVGMATDFFILDVPWAIKNNFFPLRYQDFWAKYHQLLSYLRPGGNVSVERLSLARFHDASFAEQNNNVQRKERAEKSMLLFSEREPVHTRKDAKGYWVRRFYWPRTGLVTHHEPRSKQSILRRTKGLKGRAIERFIQARSLDYYNRGQALRHSYN